MQDTRTNILIHLRWRRVKASKSMGENGPGLITLCEISEACVLMEPRSKRPCLFVRDVRLTFVPENKGEAAEQGS